MHRQTEVSRIHRKSKATPTLQCAYFNPGQSGGSG